MSWRAMEAVQDHSRYQSAREYNAFRVMLALASYADENGKVGKEGEYRACPSNTALAERAHVHRNTVVNLIPRLVEDGELEVVAEGSQGRGKWTVYQITLPIGMPIDRETAQGSREGVTQRMDPSAEMFVQFGRETAQAMQRMAEEIAQLRQLIAQGNCTNDTTVQRSVVHDPIMDPMDPVDPGDPDARASEPVQDEAPPLPTTTTVVGEGDGLESGPEAHDPRRAGELRRRAGAIAEVCGLDMRVESHRRRCEEAAGQLAGYGEATILARYSVPDGASGAGWNWYRHDWRGRKGEQPEPRWVVETIGKVWQGEEVGLEAARQDGGRDPMSNNAATARRYAELRRKFVKE